jgi:hypothetical protein
MIWCVVTLYERIDQRIIRLLAWPKNRSLEASGRFHYTIRVRWWTLVRSAIQIHERASNVSFDNSGNVIAKVEDVQRACIAIVKQVVRRDAYSLPQLFGSVCPTVRD